ILPRHRTGLFDQATQPLWRDKNAPEVGKNLLKVSRQWPSIVEVAIRSPISHERRERVGVLSFLSPSSLQVAGLDPIGEISKPRSERHIPSVRRRDEY